jgi:hypothetical protein
VVNVVLVDRTRSIDTTLLHAAAIALDQQVTKDLASVWPGISANVSMAPSIKALAPGSWPVFLVKSLPPGEGGFHLDKHNQPYAKVIASPTDDSWTIDASHEIVEMLVDPYGNRMHTSRAIKIDGDNVVDATGVFNYLVEACDPCEANDFGYQIGGILVSDFITPAYYESGVTPGRPCSFKGNITRPRELLKGGYISYVQPDGSWNQILWVDPSAPPQYRDPKIASQLATGVRSLRETIHTAMGKGNNSRKHRVRREGVGRLPATRAADYPAIVPDAQREEQLTSWYELA